MTTVDPQVSVCIPARYGSSRFPGKPLALLAGKPMIQHVYEAVQHVASVGQLMVITDQEDIAHCVKGFGGEVSIVKEDCRTGTDRVARVAAQLQHDVVVNLQADEIPLHPGFLHDLIQPFLQSQAEIGTLKRKILDTQDLLNPSIVKVVVDHQDRALYFSRSPIPHWRDGVPTENGTGAFVHLGVYIFRKPALLRFAGLPTGFLEHAEKLEQLRALEHGIPITVWETVHESLRIDDPRDVPIAAALLSGKTAMTGSEWREG